ncbi:MAG: efflux RND transporter periplasmic adaptor subunit [Planctomycetota bacterium]
MAKRASSIDDSGPQQRNRAGGVSVFIQRATSIAWFTALLLVLTLLASHRVDAQSGQVEFLEGFSQPNRISKLASAGTGIVRTIHVEEGSKVEKGQCLVELDASVHAKQLEAAQLSMQLRGELQAAQSQLASAKQRTSIIRNLASQGSATPEELLRAENETALAAANLLTTKEKLALRKAEFEKLKAESDNYCVRAPFDGILLQTLRAPGEFVGPVDPNVCVVVEIKRLSAEFIVPRKYRPAFVLNDVVDVRFVESALTLAGKIYYISPYANGETGTYKVKVRIENQEQLVNAGERCILEYAGGSLFATKRKSKAKKFVSKKPDSP